MNKRPSPSNIGVLIRFSNSADTLPSVLQALKQQTIQPNRILGVASHSTDASCEILTKAGAEIIEWEESYHHSRVLNFGLRHLDTPLVLILSSHTVLDSETALERLLAAFADPDCACASAKWNEDPYYSDVIDESEIMDKGLRFGSIYSNSMGVIRRSCWQETPFDESLSTSEDYAWALERLARGNTCHRIDFAFHYLRKGTSRDYEFAQITFHLGRRHDLPIRWLGVSGSLRFLLRSWREHRPRVEWAPVLDRLRAWAWNAPANSFPR